MSRIAGIVSRRKPETIAAALAGMTAALRHHPSYVISQKAEQAYGAAVIKLSEKSIFGQFVPNFQNRYCISFCGYVTDLADWQNKIRQQSGGKITIASEAELVCYASVTADGGLLPELNGIFACAIWDTAEEKLRLVVDRLGMRPLYWAAFGDSVAFASEVKALAAILPASEIDREGLEDLLTFGYLCDDRTVLRGVSRAAPGTIEIFSSNDHRTKNYWSYDAWPESSSMTLNNYLEGHIEVLSRSLKRLLPLAGGKPICFLSSGCDSRRLLLQLIDQQALPTVCTTAVQLKDSTEEFDTGVAQALAREFGLRQYWSDLPDPSLDYEFARYAMRMTDSECNQHRWILPLLAQLPIDPGLNFDGQGGDTIVYDSQINEKMLAIAGKTELQIDSVLDLFSGAGNRYLTGSDDMQAVRRRLAAQFQAAGVSSNWYTAWIQRQWARRRTAPFGHLILRYKMETVYPFLDNELIDFSLSFPWAKKVGRHLQHEILMKLNPELMRRIPTDSGSADSGDYLQRSRELARAIPADYRAKRRLAFALGTAKRLAQQPHLTKRMTAAGRATASMAGMLGGVISLAPPLSKLLWRLEGVGFYSIAHDLHSSAESGRQADQAINSFLFSSMR